MNIKKRLLILSSFLIASGILIAQVPHSFSSGEVLSSAKLNANFRYLSKVVKDGAGNIIGQLSVAVGGEIYVTNGNGYRFSINNSGNISTGSGGDSMNISQRDITAAPCNVVNGVGCYYSTTGCANGTQLATGSTYMAAFPGALSSDPLSPSTLYYIDKNINTAPQTVYYVFNGPSCKAVSVYTATLNNPSVTGVSSATYTLPITIVNQ